MALVRYFIIVCPEKQILYARFSNFHPSAGSFRQIVFGSLTIPALVRKK